MIREQERRVASGLAMLVVLPLATIADFAWLLRSALSAQFLPLGIAIVALIVLVVCLTGFFVVNPNEGRVLQLFGDYHGTVKTPGLRWANPFYTKKRISLRVRNFETAK